MESASVAEVLGLDFLLLLVVLIGNRSSSNRAQSALVAGLFFCSGFPALIYQIVWQRALFAIYGVNVQSVAVVVSAFMLGLGLGSLAGGRLSARYPRHGIVIFGMCELGIAAFGLVSLGLFHWAARYTAGSGLAQTILFSLLLLIVPTMLMGATLPLLVEQLVRSSRSVGYSVATLYFVNTLGSAVACYACAEVLLRNLGQSGSVTLAACINTAVGATAFLYGRSERRKVETIDVADVTAKSSTPASSLGMATLIAGFAGFIALGFEIAWFRVFALATFDRAPAFALLLSAYLAGIAAGSFLSEKVVERKRVNTLALAGTLIVLAGAVSVYLPPLMAELSSRGISVMFSVPAFFITAGLLGSVLPLLCQAAVSPDDSAGRAVSLIYLSNIVGSTLGSLGIGFVLMNYFGTEAISMELSAASVVIGAGVLFFQTGRLHAPSRWALGLIAVSVIAVPLSAATYSNLIGKLIFGAKAATVGEMKYVVENRNGIIAITPDDAVFGGGVYDGYFNIDPANDKNLVIRAYALSLLQARPKRVFMLGLASGSWAQVIANNPEVESLDVVEINPGYLQLVSRYSAVQSLLQNPKVHIYVDDARRWLVAHPDEKYDSIIANTSFHWRDHTSQVLSREYLAIVKSHLRPGGVYYYNATESPEVLVTGLHEFAYGMRVITFLAVSDSPFVLDKQRWMSVLNRYTIDGKRMFDPADSGTHTVLAAYSAFADTINQPQRLLGLEAGDALAQRLGPRHLITDDNMGAEWTEAPKPSWR